MSRCYLLNMERTETKTVRLHVCGPASDTTKLKTAAEVARELDSLLSSLTAARRVAQRRAAFRVIDGGTSLE